MEQREKLIELLCEFRAGNAVIVADRDEAQHIADYLIANGVVVLPCNTSVIEWHEVKTRPLTDEEKEYYSEIAMEPEYIFDCEMPEDGQEILIYTKWGADKDICSNDAYYGIGLEGRGDWDDVIAWAEMPTYAKRKAVASDG